MARLKGYTVDQLRMLLDRADDAERVKQLMLTIAYKQGASVGELAEWYGYATRHVGELFTQLEQGTWHGEDASGLDRLSVAGRAATPVGSGSSSVVKYLRYEAIEEYGWSLEDPDLFERAANELQGEVDRFGWLPVEPDESIAAAAERAAVDWPDGCRGGACSNCAAYLVEGKVAMSGDHVLPDEVVAGEGIRLTCVGTPTTDLVRLVFGVRHLDVLDDLLLPAGD